MRSLRGQLLALMTVSLLSALWLLGVHASRSARSEFTATFQSRMPDDAMWDPHSLSKAFQRGSWPAVTDALSETDNPTSFLLIDTTDVVVASSDTVWFGAVVGRDGQDRFRLVATEANGSRSELVLAGGVEILADTGAVVGRAFPMRTAFDDGLEEVERPEIDSFSSAFSRRVQGGVMLIVLGSVFLTGVAITRLLNPIEALRHAVVDVRRGNLRARVGPIGPREIRDVATAFDDLVDNLEQSERLRERMIRDVAHELRTPLTILRGQIESLQDGLRPLNQETVSSLHEEVALLEHLTDDLSELAQADQGLLSVDLRTLRVEPLVRDTVTAFIQAGKIEKEKITIVFPEELEARASAGRLRQILRNLLDNAVHHGGADVTVIVSGSRNLPWTEITVTDTGVGISLQHQPHLFERLYRADPARGRDGGRGLGLAIVRELTELMGGTVQLTSKPSEGTRVTIRLRATDREFTFSS